MYPQRIDEEMLKEDLLKVLRRVFDDRTPHLNDLADLLVDEIDEEVRDRGHMMPAGKNVYSLRYTVRMTLEGDARVRGENVREAQQNLLQQLTQELSIRDLVAQSVVNPICPVADIDIKDPEILHGVEPHVLSVPYIYMPKHSARWLAYDSLLETLSDIIDEGQGISDKQKAVLIADIEKVKEQEEKRHLGSGIDLNDRAVEFLKDVIRKNPEKMQALLEKYEDDDHNQDIPDFIRETLKEE